MTKIVTRKELAQLFKTEVIKHGGRLVHAFDNAGRFYISGPTVFWHHFGIATSHTFPSKTKAGAFIARLKNHGIQEFPL